MIMISTWASLWFWKKLTNRTQILLVERIFPRELSQSRIMFKRQFYWLKWFLWMPTRCFLAEKHQEAATIFWLILTYSTIWYASFCFYWPGTHPPASLRFHYMTPKFQRSLSTTSQTPDKILRNSMNEGPDRAFLPGEADSGRAARVPPQRRCKSDRASSLWGAWAVYWG